MSIEHCLIQALDDGIGILELSRSTRLKGQALEGYAVGKGRRGVAEEAGRDRILGEVIVGVSASYGGEDVNPWLDGRIGDDQVTHA
jgi:hypothetical protein